MAGITFFFFCFSLEKGAFLRKTFGTIPWNAQVRIYASCLLWCYFIGKRRFCRILNACTRSKIRNFLFCNLGKLVSLCVHTVWELCQLDFFCLNKHTLHFPLLFSAIGSFSSSFSLVAIFSSFSCKLLSCLSIYDLDDY
jgi:hypothetical protein